MNNNEEDCDNNHNCDETSTPRKRVSKPKIYECEYPDCDQKFSIRWNMLNHIKQIHLKIKFKCDQCDYEAAQKGTLVRHQLGVHGEGFRYLQCPHCPKTYKWETDFRRHLERHKNERFKCDECDKEFAEKRGLRHHIKVEHLNIKKKCDMCDFEANCIQTLKAHKLKMHEPENLFKCKFCKYRTPRKGDLRRHLKDRHLKLRQYACPHCDFLSSRKSNLQTHMKKQHIICENCQYWSLTKGDYKKHLEHCAIDPLEEKLEPFIFVDVDEE